METQQEHCHAVHFYADSRSLGDRAAKFIAEGLRQGQPAIVVATAVHSAYIMRGLNALDFDCTQLKKTGQLQVFDAINMLRSFMIGGHPDPLLFKSNVGDVIERLCVGRRPCPIRVYGEMVDVLWKEGNAEAAIRLEVLWNQLPSAYDFALLCGYAVGHFYKEIRDPRYGEVCDLHTHVI